MAETLSERAEVLRIGPHARYRDIFEPGGEENRDDYFVFSLVRNPWARLVSTFFYIMKRDASKRIPVYVEHLTTSPRIIPETAKRELEEIAPG